MSGRYASYLNVFLLDGYPYPDYAVSGNVNKPQERSRIVRRTMSRRLEFMSMVSVSEVNGNPDMPLALDLWTTQFGILLARLATKFKDPFQ